MAGNLSGPGVGAPYPQSLYPATLVNGQTTLNGNEVALGAGCVWPVPRGRWMINKLDYCVLQQLDPVTGVWRIHSSARVSPTVVDSDGFTTRVANLTGCAVAAIVTNVGTGTYVQGSTTATPSAGNSQWTPVIGGSISTTVSITAAGAGYTVPPLVLFPPPPSPGVMATAVAVIASNTVSSITVTNQGAGYTTAPVPSIIPNPTDPAYQSGAITSNATATTTLTNAGRLTALLCANPGSSFSTVPSLTIAGAGASAAATIVPMWTVTGTSITSGGAGYTTNTMITTVGGVPSATPALTNPETEMTGYIPRAAAIGISAAGGGTITTIGAIIDGGLFVGTPTVILAGQSTTPATIALTLGSTNATIFAQQLG